MIKWLKRFNKSVVTYSFKEPKNWFATRGDIWMKPNEAGTEVEMYFYEDDAWNLVHLFVHS